MGVIRESLQDGVSDGLAALRDELADAVEMTDSAHGKAALARVLLDTVDAIEDRAEPVKREGTGLDKFSSDFEKRKLRIARLSDSSAAG